MLVLTRRIGESIRIGDSFVTVVEDRNGKLRLGITAPDDVTVIRCEIDGRFPPPSGAPRWSTPPSGKPTTETPTKNLTLGGSDPICVRVSQQKPFEGR